MTFGSTDLSNTTVGTNQVPVSAVYVPGTANSNLTALEGIAINTDANSQKSSAARIGLKDGDNVVEGATTDAAVTGDNSGTISAKLRGLSKILNSVWDSVNNLLHFNLKQVGGTATDTNSGNKSAGTLRVVLATDQPALANAQPVSGTFWQATQPTSAASGAFADGAIATLGNKTDAKSTATDATSVSVMQVLKEISAMAQAPASTPVTGTFWQATQPVSGTVTANQGTNNATPWNENIAQFGGTNVATGTGAGGAGIPRVTVSNDSTVGANSATGSAVPANAFYGGGLAQTALPTAASAGNLTGNLMDKFGRLVIVPETVRDLKNNIPGLTLTTTTETTLIAAVASVFNDITSIVCENTSATAVRVDFRDSTAGTIQFSLYVPAGDTRGFSGCFYKQTTVNNNWTAQLSGAVTDIRIYGTYVANR